MASPSPRASSTWYVECLIGISSGGSRVSRRIVFVLDYSLNRIVPAPCTFFLRRVMRQPLRCARKPVRSSVYIGEVLNANAYPSEYRGAIWPAGPAGAADAQDRRGPRSSHLAPPAAGFPRVSDGGSHAQVPHGAERLERPRAASHHRL